MKIVRFDVFGSKYRYDPFTVEEYRDLLLLRAEIEDDETALDDLLEYIFPDIPYQYRWQAFMKRYIATIGKDKIKMKYKCNKCDKENLFIFNIQTDCIKYKEYNIENSNVKLKLKPCIINNLSPIDFVSSVISTVSIEDIEYNWEDLNLEEKDQVYSAIDITDIKNIKDLVLIKYQYKNKCCVDRVVNIYNFNELFKVLFTTDEIFEFYKANRILITKGYSNEDLMHMLYVERTIALSLILNEERNK